jgi:hypothetical protein
MDGLFLALAHTTDPPRLEGVAASYLGWECRDANGDRRDCKNDRIISPGSERLQDVAVDSQGDVIIAGFGTRQDDAGTALSMDGTLTKLRVTPR